MPNIYDVAQKAGVGIGTVSRVINNNPRLTEKTRQKVQKAIEDLNYQPQTAAQNLARRKTNTIGCIIPFFTGHFFIQLLRGIQQKTTAFENDLILYSVDSSNRKEIFLQRVLKERRVDGLLIVSLEIADEYVTRLQNQEVPIVLVDGFHPMIDSIKVDNVHGAFLATKHLIELGYTPIAMIDGQLKSVPARLRLEGYKKALLESNLSFEKKYFIACDFLQEADGFNKEAGHAAMRRLLALEERPRAVFVSSDIQAIGAMEAIRESGLRGPEDIAIIGFDDIELAQYVGLTTVRQPTKEMGELAVERLISKINDEDTSDFKHRFDTKIIVRQTCGGQV